MSPYQRNILVGLTVLIASIVLGWMTLMFGGKSVGYLVTPETAVTFASDRADGLAEGSPVNFRGVNVGRVIRTRRGQDQLNVLIDANIEKHPPLSANLKATIRAAGLVGGGSTIELEFVGPPSNEPLMSGQVIPTKYVGLELVPRELADLANELRLTAEQLRKSNLIGNIVQAVQVLQLQMSKAGDVMDAIKELVGDPKMRQDIQAAVANFRDATESAGRVGKNLEKLSAEASDTLKQARGTLTRAQTNIDDIGGRIGDRLTQIAAVLENVHSISSKIDKGQGTAGLLVNDPKLYQSLVDTSKELKLTITDLKRLIEQWEQEGVTVKLGK